MEFLKPEYLIFMSIPLVIFSYFIFTNKSKINLFFDKEILEKLRLNNDSFTKKIRNILLFVALFLMIIALARPVILKDSIHVESKTIDMMVAIDISKSMLATDIYPNRLLFAKKKFFELVDSFKEANIAVVAFSSDGFLVSPMTQDSTTLKYLVKNLSLESLSSYGTDMMVPINKAELFLKESKKKILIVFTDGGDAQDFNKEIETAKDKEVIVYIYAIGDKKGAPIKENGETLKDANGNIVITKLNENIKDLALQSGGAYIVGGHNHESISLVVHDIKNKFKALNSKGKEVKEYKELFYYPLGLAILCLFMAFSSLPNRKIFNQTSLVLICLSLFQTPSFAGVFDFLDIQNAQKSYKQKEFKKSQELYEKIADSKQSNESFYDLANAQYKNKEYEKALENYEKIKTEDKKLNYKKNFNTANSHFQMKEYEKALKSYEKAKEIKSEDDLLNNIKLTKKMIKKKKDQNKDGDKKQDKKKDNKKDKQNDNKTKKDKNNKEKEGQKPTEKKGKKDDEKMSDLEEKKWLEELDKIKTKTMPLQLKKDTNRRVNETSW